MKSEKSSKITQKGPSIVYVRSFLDNESLYTIAMAKKNMAKVQNQLLSEGYTMYLDGYSTYFFNDTYYQAAQQMEQSGNMNFILGFTYEIDSWMDLEESLQKAAEKKKFASARIKPNWIKLFMEGTVESGTGFIEPLYPDGHQGIPNWTEEELTEITRKANANGDNKCHSEAPCTHTSKGFNDFFASNSWLTMRLAHYCFVILPFTLSAI